jgi:hypothetical protein
VKGVKQVNEAVKYDAGKPRVSLIPPSVILRLADVFGYGAGKYGENNWRLGLEPERLYDAAMRHLLSWMDGESHDESGCPHLAHALWNVAVMLEIETETGRGGDSTISLASPK